MSKYTNTPYHLYWSRQQYREFGSELGFEFDMNDFQRAPSNECLLGTKRYLPRKDAPVELGFPPGVPVRCYLVPTVGLDSPMLNIDLEELIPEGDSELSALAEKASTSRANALITPSNLPDSTLVEPRQRH